MLLALLLAAAAAPEGPARMKAPTSTEKPASLATGGARTRGALEEEVARDAAADAKRDELIQELQAIIPKIPEGDRKAELDFQLAELWWEKARYVALQEVKDYDDAFAAWSASKRNAEPKVSTRKSDDFRREALKLYQVILHDYPAYERRDEVLFVAAYNRYEIGEKKEAVANYTELIQKHPRSKFVPDAYVQLGEHYFTSNDLAHARASFEKAASFKLPKLYSFALYRLAWCDYNAGDYAAAIDKFKQVIAYSDAEATAADRIQLKNEALKDIVLSYARIDSVEPAEAYLEEKGGERSTDYVNRLASTYFETGKLLLAIRVYNRLIEQSPSNVRAPAWQEKVLLSYDKLGRRDQVVLELKRLVSDFGPKSKWAAANEGQKGALAEANELAESALRELVRDYHQEAIKTRNVATYKLARDIYREYLETFPASEAAYSERFFYAEILYSLEQWDDAAAQYALVVDADPKGTYSTKAAYDAILALEKSVAIGKGKLKKRDLADAAKIDDREAKGQVDQSRSIKVQAVTKEIPEEAIPDNEAKLVSACDKYVAVAGGAKDEIVIRYKAALVEYDHKHFIDAAKRFGDIIDRFPGDAFSQKAADLSLDILNTKEAWLAAAELTTRFLHNQALTPPGSQFEKDVTKIGERARFNQVMQVYEVQKDYAAAASGFKEFVAQYPKSENAPKALYNAMIIADKADQLDVELAAGEQLLTDYPKAGAEIVKLAIPALASAAERSASYPHAVAWYEDAQGRWPLDAKAADWLYNAAVWREALDDDAGALADWRKYLQQYGSRPDAAKIAFAAGLCLERQQRPLDAANYWRSYQRQYGGSATPGQLLLARYKEGIALREARLSDAAAMADVTQRYARLSAEDKGALPLLDAAAHARFLGVESSFNEFIAIHFQSTRQGDLVKALNVKTARMAKLRAAYGEVIAIGSPRWSEAAFDRLGEAYRNFNKGLLDAPTPKGLDQEQQELYRSTLESQALPFEDKASEEFGKAVEVSQKSGVYSEWVIKAQDFLREYQAGSFDEVHKPAFEGRAFSRAVAPEGGS